MLKAGEDKQRFERDARVAAQTLMAAQAATQAQPSQPDRDAERLASACRSLGAFLALPCTCLLSDHSAGCVAAPPVAQWQSFCADGDSPAWDAARTKIPTAAGEKYLGISEILRQEIPSCAQPSADAEAAAATVVLHEPGFHHCLPMLQCSGNRLLACSLGDSVQEEELHRRERPVALLPAAGDPLLGEPPLGPGGILLVLLWEGGAASWDEAFGELVRRTLALEAVHAAAAATLWLACESSAEPEATLGQLEGLVMGGRGLAARGWRWGVESSQPLFSLSRRYVVAQLLLRYEPPA